MRTAEPGRDATGDWGPPVGSDPMTGQEWRRLHPLSPLIRAGGALAALAVPLLVGIGSGIDVTSVEVEAGILVLLVVVSTISWIVTRWRLEPTVLRVDTGLVRRSSRRFPVGQIQAVDVVAPATARLLGLAEVRLRVAGHSGRSARLAYLPRSEAEALRERLVAMARSGPPPVLGGPAERAVVEVRTGRLLCSLVVSGPGLLLAAAGLGLGVLAACNAASADVALSGSVTALAGLVTDMWRRLNSGYGLRVTEDAGAFRVRSGLLQTAAETIPFGRVQAVRVAQPWLWRAIGWYRVDVDVAGGQHGGGDDQAEGRSLRSLLPVGTRADADLLVARLVPDAPRPVSRPPRRAAWKSPLRYRRLAWGGDDRFVVASSGRLRRVTSWVPLGKVQGVRLVAGPLQRSLRLATVHLDTAGRNVHVALRDRDVGEAGWLAGAVPDQCRRARERDRAVVG